MGFFGDYFGSYGATGESGAGLWSAEDLVARCKRLAGRPANDEMMSDAQWCALLTEAQVHWFPIVATHAPSSQIGVPVALTLAEDRKTASFPAGVIPFGKVELYDGINGRRLYPGDYEDPMADFVIEGSSIRAPLDREFSVGSGGLYARYADAGNLQILTEAAADEQSVDPREPVLMPPHARMLLVYNALAAYATIGGYQDPAVYERQEVKLAWDDPATGKLGLVTTLKLQFQDQDGGSGGTRVWWRSGDLGNLRHRMV